MPPRVAVVADALSSDFIFPHWYRYYGQLFGAENIFLVTYAGLSNQFRGFTLGGLVELPVGYDDQTRRRFVNSFVASLFACYDVVVRVDVDEFLVVDPREGCTLGGYIEAMTEPYLAARGFDVVQMEGERALGENPVEPILSDRSFAYANSALNKTCITKMPIAWTDGFHWANVHPKFGPVFMLHMKRVDVDWQVGWFTKMTENIKDNPKVVQIFKDYYAPDEAKIRSFHKSVSARNRIGGGIQSWYRDNMMDEYMSRISLNAAGTYYGKYGQELNVLCELPPEWKALI